MGWQAIASPIFCSLADVVKLTAQSLRARLPAVVQQPASSKTKQQLTSNDKTASLTTPRACLPTQLGGYTHAFDSFSIREQK